jgi:hypothetical protein
MPLIVQKFGGTSVADSQKILAAARRAVRAHQDGNQVVMVVSAMGHQTDILVDLAKQITDDAPAREMDMLLSTGEQESVALLAMAVQKLGEQAISMTGAQIGIVTDSTYTKARIRSISASIGGSCVTCASVRRDDPRRSPDALGDPPDLAVVEDGDFLLDQGVLAPTGKGQNYCPFGQGDKG